MVAPRRPAADTRTGLVRVLAAWCLAVLMAACGGGDAPASDAGVETAAGRVAAATPASQQQVAATEGVASMSGPAQPFVTAPKIAAGSIDNVALKADGTIWVWGRFHGFAPLQVGGPLGALPVVAIAGPADPPFALALTRDGAVWTWSMQSSGSAGILQPVVGVGGTGTLTGVTALAPGVASHSMVLKSDGTVLAWGQNEAGALGNGSTTYSATPVPVQGPGGIGLLDDVSAVARGGNHSLALKSDGTVRAWGGNAAGQLGNHGVVDSAVPVQVVGAGGTGFLSGVTAVAAGTDFSLALKGDGTVWAWGGNVDGMLGNNGTDPSPYPVQVAGPGGAGVLSGVTAISAGRHHALALKNDGTVWAWGANADGTLGNDSTVPSRFPVQVVGPMGAGVLSGITAVSGGAQHSLALKGDGSVWAWGYNSGELGNPPPAPGFGWSLVPVQVRGPDGVGFLNLGAAAPPVLATSVSSIDFGFVTVGTTRERTLVLSNAGPSTLTGSLTVGAPFFVVGNSSFQLGAGASARITIAFSAAVASRVAGTLEIRSNAGDRSIDVVAMGVAPPQVAPRIDRIAGPLPAGAVVAIGGAHFGASPGRLSIGGIEVTSIEFWGDRGIRARIPAGVHAGWQTVGVTTSAGSDRRRLHVLPPTPHLVRLDERRVTPGSDLVVDGYHLGAEQATSRITIKDVEASVVRWSDTRVVVRVPDLPAGRWPLEVVTPQGSATRWVVVRDEPVQVRYGPCLPAAAEACPPMAGFAAGRRGETASLQFENTADRWYEVRVTPSAAAAVTLPPGPLWLGPGGSIALHRAVLPASAAVKIELTASSELAVMLQALDLLAQVCAEVVRPGACPTLPLDSPDPLTLAVVQALLANPALADAAADLQAALAAGFHVKAVDAMAVFVKEALKSAGAIEPFAHLGFDREVLVRCQHGLWHTALAHRVGSTLAYRAVYADAPTTGAMTFRSR
jgi:alpha-tubulin suppressor-like RCC1 family protein